MFSPASARFESGLAGATLTVRGRGPGAFGRKFISGLALISCLLGGLPSLGAAADLVVGQFSHESLSNWEEKVFKGKTIYRFEMSGGRMALAARSSGSASGFVRRDLQVDPALQPMLRWSWKISRTVVGEQSDRKSGDDYAARVYLIFPGRFFWQTRAICYVWSGSMAAETFRPSPFTANVVNIAVASGNGEAGSWRSEERDYAADFRRYFGTAPPPPTAIGLMTDADNTGDSVTAWYGDIAFGARR